MRGLHVKGAAALLCAAGVIALSACSSGNSASDTSAPLNLNSSGSSFSGTTTTTSTTGTTGTGGTGSTTTTTSTLNTGCAYSSVVTTDVICVTMSISTASVPADGTSTATVAAAVTRNGVPVVGDVVKFTVQDSLYGTMSIAAGVTNGSGIATGTFQAGVTAGATRINAEYDTAKNYTAISLTPYTGTVATLGAGCAASSTVSTDVLCIVMTAGKTTLIGNGTDNTSISATLTKNGIAYAGQVIDFSLSNTLYGTLSSQSALTNASGTATVALTAGTSAGAMNVTGAFDKASNYIGIGVSYYAPPPGATLASSCAYSSTVSTDVICMSVTTSTTSLTADGSSQAIITAVATRNGNPIAGDVVDFTLSDPTYGTLLAATGLTDATGKATTTFQAKTALGAEKITGTYDTASSYTAVGLVAPTVTAAGGIQFISATPASIGVQGSGQVTNSTVVFNVTDSSGAPVSGQAVGFSMIGPTGAYITPTSATTDAGGNVSVTLNSGYLAGTVTITATSSTFSASSSVISIGGAVPSASHFSLATQRHNLPGLIVDGFKTKLSVYIADRFSNSAVLKGTQVSLYTEAGAVDKCVNLDATTNICGGVDSTGAGTANFRTQNPLPVDTPTLGLPNPSDGWVTVIAVVRGEESFVDVNGNGVFDGSDPFSDLSEPYIDANNNGVWDGPNCNVAPANQVGCDPTNPGEFYVDTNGNGQFDGPNGVWDGPGCTGSGCVQSPYIWVPLTLMFTGNVNNCKLDTYPTPGLANFSISAGSYQDFKFTVGDVNGNWPVPGTTITLSATGPGTLIGSSSFTVPDAISNGLYTGYIRLAHAGTAGSASVTLHVTTPASESVAACTDQTIFGTLN